MNNNMIIPNCPSYSELEQLAFGNLPQAGNEGILKHINECPYCKEVFDALKETNPEDLGIAEQEINSLIDKRLESISQPESKKQNGGRIIKMVAKYAAAASFVGFGVWGIIKIGDSDPNINPAAQQQEYVESASETNHPEMEDGKLADLEQVSAIEEVEKESVKPVAKDPVSSSSESRPSTSTGVQRQDVVSESADPKIDNIRHIKSHWGDNTEITRGGAQEVVVELDLKPVANPENAKILAKAKDLVSAGNYLDAKDLTEDILNDDPANSEAMMLTAICDMKLGYYEQAISCFKKVIPASKAEAEQVANYIKECEAKMMK